MSDIPRIAQQRTLQSWCGASGSDVPEAAFHSGPSTRLTTARSPWLALSKSFLGMVIDWDAQRTSFDILHEREATMFTSRTGMDRAVKGDEE